MVLKPDMEERLRLFLESEERSNDLQEIRQSVDGLRDEIREHDTADQLRHQELLHGQTTLSTRVGLLEGRIDGVEDVTEKTGRHNLDSIRAKAKELEHAKTFWVRWAVGTSVTIVLGATGWVLVYALTH